MFVPGRCIPHFFFVNAGAAVSGLSRPGRCGWISVCLFYYLFFSPYMSHTGAPLRLLEIDRCPIPCRVGISLFWASTPGAVRFQTSVDKRIHWIYCWHLTTSIHMARSPGRPAPKMTFDGDLSFWISRNKSSRGACISLLFLPVASYR
jgi:hypothetical protein